MTAEGYKRLLIWSLTLAVLAAVSVSKLNLSYDLGLFLPEPESPQQRLLVERLGDSPGSRFVMMALPDERQALNNLLEGLSEAPALERVISDLLPPPPEAPEPLFSYRYLLADMDWSAPALGVALEQRLADLGLGEDERVEQLISQDPTLQSLAVMDQLQPPASAPWVTEDGQRVIIAETRAAAFDLQGQADAIAAIKQQVATAFGPDVAPTLSGAGVFGVNLRSTIEEEARWRTLGASAAILMVLLLVYRSLPVLVLAALPLAAGVVTGVSAVSLAFGQVHGITLAFGFTLLGVAIDYPLHYLSRARYEQPPRAMKATWPTLRLSALSTMLAYGALIAGGAQGMAQLGLFSAFGVLGALLTTRWLLPAVTPATFAGSATQPDKAFVQNPGLRFSVPIALLVLAGVIASMSGPQLWWSSDLAALSPVPKEQLDQERRLRSATQAPNIRHQIAVQGADLQKVLETSQTVRVALEEAVEQGTLDGFNGADSLLPAASLQKRRQAAIPAPEVLAERLAGATAALPFAASAFEPFLADAEASRQGEPLRMADFTDSVLEPLLDSHLTQSPTGVWSSLFTLQGTPDIAALGLFLQEAAPDALLIDYRLASEELVENYRHRTFLVLAGVLLLLTLLLGWQVRPARASWALMVVLGSVAFTACVLRWFGGPLDLYQLTGLLLVAGIGLDYALFLGKPDRIGSMHAVVACMASTVAAFGVLAFSSVPALNSLGGTVALGSATAFLAAWLGSSGTSASQQAGETAQ